MNKWIAEFELEDGDTMPEHMDLNYKGAKIDFHCKPLEKEPTTKNDLGVDAVSRQAVRDTIYVECSGEKLNIDFAKVLLLQRAIKALPSVTPQEPKIIPIAEIKCDEDKLKSMVEIDLYSVIKQKYIEREVLDKIRAEIEALKNVPPCFDDMYEYKCAVDDVLAIIDKHKGRK